MVVAEAVGFALWLAKELLEIKADVNAESTGVGVAITMVILHIG